MDKHHQLFDILKCNSRTLGTYRDNFFYGKLSTADYAYLSSAYSGPLSYLKLDSYFARCYMIFERNIDLFVHML